ncbi:molybdopterin-guanine dinucleotide biosynthesis protein A [Microbacterium sp. AK009]|uniref:molybdenum cofactor guanylyltransferase n=1 Tax=Microbacterium sp. AK009 TaxID=2723068 RepID=UPI0015CBEE76|nr:NTP transferase domain-containing protein [Microbacterium sp. AK009]NYF17688.1 molybdopterin-guanine dinucleotide biosynthesis protein A [Microbacterium sp. AK009]
MIDLSAILLAGGRARRLGGVAKPLQTVGGRSLLDIAVAAATRAGADPIIAVGPEMPVAGIVRWTREDPPFGGPVAGIIAGFDAARAATDAPSTWTLVLACDLPHAESAVPLLTAAAALVPNDVEAVCLGDATSRPQFLVGLFRTAPLGRRIERMPQRGRDAAVRDLVNDLAVTVVTDPGAAALPLEGAAALSFDSAAALSFDVDTWEDLEAARRAREDGNRE